MTALKYLAGYAPELQQRVQAMIDQNTLNAFLQQKHPKMHEIRSDAALREYVVGLKNQHMKKSGPLSKVAYDNKIHVIHNALGTHHYVSRVQGGKLKAKNEIRISTVFKTCPIDFLKMIVVHELAHLKERDHNKAFYNLCENMLPGYHQTEFEMRLYLTQRELDQQKTGNE
ncbi:M48 family metallopeptidase [Pontiella sp.]|uniref:M48 metallopeptidase family protein n=1 Tax=Pontiella sp. TaxID=2837462 RepID=UPI0035636516